MNDDELRQALNVLDTYKMQLEALSNQAQILQMSLEESVRARDTLKALENAKEGDDILIPVGALSFVPAKVSGEKKVIMGVGNRISVEKDLQDAAEYMKSTIDEISEALKKSTDALSEIDAAARNLSSAIQQEYQRRQ